MTPCDKILKAALDHKAGTVQLYFWVFYYMPFPPVVCLPVNSNAPARVGSVGHSDNQEPTPAWGLLSLPSIMGVEEGNR